MEGKIREYESLLAFGHEEQLMLLLTRKNYDEELIQYIQKMICQNNIEWDKFLGMATYHRVAGVIGNRINRMEHVPSVVKRSLLLLKLSQDNRNKYHTSEISKVFLQFEKCGINYAFLKGAILNSIIYDKGERVSNDTDILANREDLDKIVKICRGMGYTQGSVKGGKLIKATKKEVLFAKLNTYEITPLIKSMKNEYLPFHEIDVNFRLGNDDKGNNAEIILANTEIIENDGVRLRTMAPEKFLVYLCIHLYREAIMVYKIIHGDDLVLYKFMDIHYYILSNRNRLLWSKVVKVAQKLNKEKDVYFSLFFVEKLYPGTVDDDVLQTLNVSDRGFLNQYKGRDNTNDVYTWENDFYKRMFSPHSRICEATKNIAQESKRFNSIREELKHD